MSTRHPVRKFFGEAMQTPLSVLLNMQESMCDVLRSHNYSGRHVLGYKLPEWQRGEAWDEKQCVRFIESAWLGINLGAFMVNESEEPEFDVVLLDGQQRLTALKRYWEDSFPILAPDGNEYYWSDLDKQEQAQFLRIPFPWIQTRYNTEEELREAYNRHNFGGTPHNEGDKA